MESGAGVKGNTEIKFSEEWWGKQQRGVIGSLRRRESIKTREHWKYLATIHLQFQHLDCRAGRPMGQWEVRSLFREKNRDEMSDKWWGNKQRGHLVVQVGGWSMKHGNIENIWPTSTFNYYIWITEQADPWCQELVSRKTRRLNWPNNDGESSWWRHLKGKAGVWSMKHWDTENICPPSTSNSNTWIVKQVDPWGQELVSREAQKLNWMNY